MHPRKFYDIMFNNSFFSGDVMLSKYFFVFLVSMVPLIELRGAIPIAMGMGLETIPSIVICAIGNLLPVPVIYLFARKFLVWGLDKPGIGGICHFFHDKGLRAGHRLSGGKYGRFGLMIAMIAFVGIPIPGTGAWTGTLGASFLDMGSKKTVVSVSLGVAVAAVIMATVSKVGIHVFGL